jgi:IclR family transcriptional regulator, acetate operon repressor
MAGNTIATKLDQPDPDRVVDPDRIVGADRVLGILVELSRHPDGIGLEDLARLMKSSKPTVHRALGALRRADLATRDGRGHYVLSDEFVRMAFAHHEARPDDVRLRPVLEDLAGRYLETAHFGVLDGRSIVYRAKVDPPRGAIKLTSTVGGRNPAHSTGIGKLLLAFQLRDLNAVESWVGSEPLVRRTENTRTTAKALHEELGLIRSQGFGVDDQENELQINCIALPVFLTSPSVPSGAISISALAYRTPLSRLIEELPTIQAIFDARGIATSAAVRPE